METMQSGLYRCLFFLMLIAALSCNGRGGGQQTGDAGTAGTDSVEGYPAGSSQGATGGTANQGSTGGVGEGDSVTATVAGAGSESVSSPAKTARFGHFKVAALTRGDGSARSLVIAVTDLKGDSTRGDSTMERDIKGTLQRVAVADLDGDNNPEVYCFTQSAGNDAYGSIYGFVYNKGKMTRILPGDADSLNIKGYRGRDSFYVQQPYLVRTFPFYEQEKVDATPSGKRTVKYRLEKEGEAYKLVAGK